ncbi:DUF445 family protein [bacterium]|nr:DUF445 family protein [bacterium]
MNWIIPLVGLLIGWGTNILAIEMLFKPSRPIILFGRTLPFTPGLIYKHRKQIVKESSSHVSQLIFDSFTSVDKGSDQLKLFNKILDSHWFTYLFVSPKKRQVLYKSIVNKVTSEQEIKELIHSLMESQMMQYDIDSLEHTVRSISNNSLRGIKIIGALTGGLVGLLTMLIGV